MKHDRSRVWVRSVACVTASLIAVPLGGLIASVTAQGAAAAVSTYAVPGKPISHAITSGPDGALWFTGAAPDSIDRITTSGVVTQFTDSTISDPWDITSGPDGAL